MKKIRVAINGFGRIGRTLSRILLSDDRFEIIAVNDLADIATMAHLLRYDSIHGKSDFHVQVDGDCMIAGDHRILFSTAKSPDSLPWKELDIDFVIESTGNFKKRTELEGHLVGNNRKVILSVPPEDDSICTVVLGVNDSVLHDNERIISNASCTTNNAAPMIAILDELCGIESVYITTVHSYTGDQRLHDAPHKDLRRSRAAVQSIIPTTTGAAKALTRIFPHLADKMGGCGMRVPVPDGSLTDITCIVQRPRTIQAINAAFREQSEGNMKGILEYTEDPIVSSDIIGNPHSCVFDAQLTSVIGSMVKVVGWYDNEFGYSSRLRDLMLKMSAK